MKFKIVSQCNESGHFAGFSEAQEDPRNPGTYLLPAGAVDVEAPVVQEGFVYQINNEGSAWIAEKIPEPEPELEPEPVLPGVPQTVSSRSAKHALLDAGLFLHVEEVINSTEGTEGITARIEWNAPSFQRNSAFLIQMALTLGLTEEQLDDLFILAATYE